MNKDYDEEEVYAPFPETYTRRKLNALYRQIPLKDTTFRTLRKYFNAMANLYGIIPLGKAYKIISEQSPSLVTEDEFLAFAEVARHECECYTILGEDELSGMGKLENPFRREIIDFMLLAGDPEIYFMTKENQLGKPYFIPPKKQFLLYADEFYFEPTPETAALRDFIIKEFKDNNMRASTLVSEIVYNMRYFDAEVADALSFMGDIGYRFKSGKAMRKFTALYIDCHNKTRMQCNRGYTPHELSSRMAPKTSGPISIKLGPGIRAGVADGTLDVDTLINDTLTANLSNEKLRSAMLGELNALKQESAPKKVGRNDPCPCGSGKKYKKCCGLKK